MQPPVACFVILTATVKKPSGEEQKCPLGNANPAKLPRLRPGAFVIVGSASFMVRTPEEV
eukprot:NODE_6551_length_621_cov_5.010490_g5588_i0.p3 GENE.NODE_6551_length_621_cov_5.010490_g5588_i0~~NODE_6551_length_621_cov_5.010490_g5588_i0.p3  ORF type:complete len:60 (+),score=1.41 NODE_6551_length_621_cov_5.010490_g5588_i0:364-543(+)